MLLKVRAKLNLLCSKSGYFCVVGQTYQHWFPYNLPKMKMKKKNPPKNENMKYVENYE